MCPLQKKHRHIKNKSNLRRSRTKEMSQESSKLSKLDVDRVQYYIIIGRIEFNACRPEKEKRAHQLYTEAWVC